MLPSPRLKPRRRPLQLTTPRAVTHAVAAESPNIPNETSLGANPAEERVTERAPTPTNPRVLPKVEEEVPRVAAEVRVKLVALTPTEAKVRGRIKERIQRVETIQGAMPGAMHPCAGTSNPNGTEVTHVTEGKTADFDMTWQRLRRNLNPLMSLRRLADNPPRGVVLQLLNLASETQG